MQTETSQASGIHTRAYNDLEMKISPNAHPSFFTVPLLNSEAELHIEKLLGGKLRSPVIIIVTERRWLRIRADVSGCSPSLEILQCVARCKSRLSGSQSKVQERQAQVKKRELKP